MYTYRTFSEEKQEEATRLVREMLPEDVPLAQLSFTGGRAFGWGDEPTDIDLRGFIAKEDWFSTLYANPGNSEYDVTLKNIESLEEPQFREYLWKQYYDNSNPIFIHDDFDYDAWMNTCAKSKVHNIYPYDLKVQMGRMDSDFNARNCLHTYKELLIPLYYIRHDDIETDVTQINENIDIDLPGLEQCVENYGPHGGGRGVLDEDTIRAEIDYLFETLGDEIPEHDGTHRKIVTS